MPAQEASGLGDLAQSLIFPAILFAGLFFLSRRAGGAGGGMGGPGNPMGFGKSKAEVQMVPDTGVSFDDVAGCDGAKLELAEVVDFLKQPEAYTKNGCRIPRGVILDGMLCHWLLLMFVIVIEHRLTPSCAHSVYRSSGHW